LSVNGGDLLEVLFFMREVPLSGTSLMKNNSFTGQPTGLQQSVSLLVITEHDCIV
jgi:hypothetical protein